MIDTVALSSAFLSTLKLWCCVTRCCTADKCFGRGHTTSSNHGPEKLCLTAFCLILLVNRSNMMCLALPPISQGIPYTVWNIVALTVPVTFGCMFPLVVKTYISAGTHVVEHQIVQYNTVCTYLCMYICTYIQYVHVYIYVFICTYDCIYVHTYIHMYVQSNMHAYVCTYICIIQYVCMYVCMYNPVCMHMYVMYVHIVCIIQYVCMYICMYNPVCM